LHLCVALSLNVKHPLKTLAVLSPCRGDGKSTVAFKLATGMATLRSRVLLVDADMRRPTLHEKADCPNLTGLSDVLEGTVPLRSAVQRVAPNLDLLSSGHGLSNPVALLQSQLEAILDTASAQYSMVILDAPALAAVSDGLLIARYVDGSLLVVIEDVTDEREARTTVGQLKSLGIDNLLGIVANRDTRRHNTSYADYFDRKAGGTAIMGEET